MHLAVLAVLSYRAISFWLPTPLGVVAYIQLRRTVARWREEQGERSATDGYVGTPPAGTLGEFVAPT